MENSKNELALADLLFVQGCVKSALYNRDEAYPLFRQCADIRRTHLGRHADTARAIYMQAKQIGLHETPFQRLEELTGLISGLQTVFED